MVEMYWCLILLITAYTSAGYKFPPNFLFGVATSAVQQEGAWSEDGKGENIWDFAVHNTPDQIEDGSNANIASDGYHKYKEDVQLLKFLGADFYRFSISWSRILPNGKADTINSLGIKYYNGLINELLANGIQPHATMYFWDLPQAIQEEGGWRSKKIIKYFVDYADILFAHFGDRVKNWITLNEVLSICEHGYGNGALAPFINASGIGNYECAHFALLAHAEVFHLYKNKYEMKQKGIIGIGLDSLWFEPKDPDSEQDHMAAQTALEMTFEWLLRPLVFGDYPKRMIDRIKIKSGIQRFDKTRLPTFTQEEQERLKNSLDFLGLNFWTQVLVQPSVSDLEPIPSLLNDMNIIASVHPSWPGSAASWLKTTPWALPKILKFIKTEYNIPVMIAENGFADKGELEDRSRADYHRTYLDELLNAMFEDDLNVLGYTAWTLTDNWVWIWGYTQKFGLFSVDFTKDDRPRTPKLSAYIYKHIIETREVDLEYSPSFHEHSEKKLEEAPRLVPIIISAITGVLLVFLIKKFCL